MIITLELFGCMTAVEVSEEVADFLDQSKRKNRNLSREAQAHWDGREADEYIIASEGRLPHQDTPEEAVCHKETLDEILSILSLCTEAQQERFLLYALYDYSYSEIGRRCGCSKYAVRDSIEAVRKFFKNFF